MIGNNFKTLKARPGFSLAEMLVSVGVFALAVMLSSAVFLNVNGLQQQTAGMERLQNDGRYVLERLGKEIRGRELDYSRLFFSAGGVSSRLVFKKDEYDEILEIFFDEQEKKLFFSLDGPDGFRQAQINSDDVIVAGASFIVTPQNDPFDWFATSTPSAQPRVTILLQLQNKVIGEKYRRQLNLQTTFSSKVYR